MTIPGPDDNTEDEDFDEECKHIYESIMYEQNAALPDPRHPDMSNEAVKMIVEQRQKKAKKAIEKYKKSLENTSKDKIIVSPLSNKTL